MTARPVVLHGNNVESNRGCQALRLTTQLVLDRYLPGTPRLHANIFRNDDPQFYGRLADPQSAGQVWETPDRLRPGFYVWGARVLAARILRRFPAMRVHDSLAEAAALVAVGGDNLSYDYGFLATLLFFSPLDAAIRRNVPTAIWGASIGPFSSRPYWERRLADLLRQVNLITIREPITQEYLDRLGVRDNVHRVTDPAFLLPTEPADLPAELERALAAGAIGVNLAPLMTRFGRLSAKAWRDSSQRLLAAICGRTSRPVVLIPHVMMSPRIFSHNDDFGFLSGLHRELPSPQRRRVLLYDARRDSSMQIKWVISRLRVLVASRFHAAVAGLSSAVPTLCLGYGVKARGLFLDIFGHDDWQQHIAEFDPAAFERRLQRLLAAEDELRGHLQRTIPAYAQEAWKSGELLRGLLREKAGAPLAAAPNRAE
jgi:colanic acid/amylovoran biosynthesis protein